MLGFFTSSCHVVPALSTGPLERAGHDDVGLVAMPPPTGNSLLSRHLVFLFKPCLPRCPPPLVFLAAGVPGYLLPHLRGPFADINWSVHSCLGYWGVLEHT